MTRLQPSKIVCIGRNYAKHAAELGNDVPAEPLIFLKPPSSIISDGDPIVMPAGSGRVDFEAEIGVVIGKQARHVSGKDAWEYVSGLGSGQRRHREGSRGRRRPVGTGDGL